MVLTFQKGWLLLALAGCTVAAAQAGVPAQQSRQDPVRVTAFPQGVFRLASGRLASTVNLKEEIAGCTTGIYDLTDPKSRPSGGEADTRVLDLVRKGGAWYLTFQATLNSGCNVQGMCGAGTATTLVWLKLTPALKVAAKQAEVIEDCAANIGIDQYTGMKTGATEPYATLLELRRGRMEVVSVLPDYDKKTDTLTTVRYQHAFPEKGLSVSSRQVAQK